MDGLYYYYNLYNARTSCTNKKNIDNKNTSGLSLFLFIILSFTFVSWVTYGIYKPDWFIVIPNGLGAVFAIVLVFQIFYYGRKNELK
ncbi:MAG: SemiSWEET family sugar transporter [Oligoflexales bacterium]